MIIERILPEEKWHFFYISISYISKQEAFQVFWEEDTEIPDIQTKFASYAASLTNLDIYIGGYGAYISPCGDIRSLKLSNVYSREISYCRKHWKYSGKK